MGSSEEYITNADLFPLVLQFSPAEPTVEAVRRNFEQADAVYARGGKIAWLTILPSHMKLNNQANRLAAGMLKERQAQIKGQAVGIGLFCESKIYSFLVSTLMLVQPMPVEYKAGSKLEELVGWLALKLRDEGTELAPNAAAGAAALIADRKRVLSVEHAP